MSTADNGDAKIVADVVASAKSLLADQAREAEQLDMLDPVSPEEMIEAREEMGPQAGNMSVLRLARERKRGRPPGARNKRTDDFARYILGFGQHPAITMMQIQATPAEVLIEASRQRKVHSFRKDGTPNIVIERLSYEAAQSLRIRCAEGLLPYLESKKPVAVDLSFNGVADLMIEGVTHTREEMGDILEADFLPVDGDEADEA
ncbi:hypothetical protein [Sphingomonas sp. LaA6.9]|uniref:hypothetical protein n=1 Tax=Sphingomonas sp. LaA6.9 TaxID=2919914 RepID=UPI001F4F99E7|nr:hypothetical protein [Sphingomonas sp. LaA6.9]MCJ8158844.1 hypothetical protein [Sphingomonas sp. LaA6.9]